MSTLTTRIAGFKFVVRDATPEEVSDWVRTATDMGWQMPNLAECHSVVGRFYADDSDDVMALPYELRSTWMRIHGDVLTMAAYAIEELRDSSCYRDHGNCYVMGCDHAAMIRALDNRMYRELRGHAYDR